MSGRMVARRGAVAAGGKSNVVPVAFQAAGVGSAGANSFNPSISRTISTTATAASGLAGLLLMRHYASNNNFGSRVATWGGVNMTELVFLQSGTAAVSIHGILLPLTGAQDVIGGITGGSNAGRQVCAFTGVYQNVGSFGAGLAQETVPLTITSAVGEMVAAVGGSTAGAVSAFTQTVRNANINAGGSPALQALWGDAVGAAPDVSFNATNFSMSACVRLLPAA